MTTLSSSFSTSTRWPPVTLVYEVFVSRLGTKALLSVMAVEGKVPFKTWYVSRAVRRPGSAERAANVALSTFAKAALEGARRVMFWRLLKVWRMLAGTSPASVESSLAAPVRAVTRSGAVLFWATARPARARTESDLTMVMA